MAVPGRKKQTLREPRAGPVCTASLESLRGWNGPAPACWPHLTLGSGQGASLGAVPSPATNHFKSPFPKLREKVLEAEKGGWGGGQENDTNNSH